MPSLKNSLLIVLALTTIGSAMLAWRQHQELVQLRAAAFDPTERAAWQKRLSDLEAKRTELEQELVAARQLPPEPEPPAFATATPAAFPAVGQGAPVMAAQRFRPNPMDDPEVQQLMTLQLKASLDFRYADLFKSLRLTPAQLDKFKNLLVEKNTAVADVMAAARQEGISRRADREAFDKLVADAQAEVDESIRQTLGEAAYAQYKEFEQTGPQRAVANQLEQRLSYSSTPLTSDQASQLVRILSANAAGGSDSSSQVSIGPGARGRMPTITDAVINQARGVLAAPQVEALIQIQQEQQAQAQLSAAMRRRAESFRPATQTSGSSTGGR